MWNLKELKEQLIEWIHLAKRDINLIKVRFKIEVEIIYHSVAAISKKMEVVIFLMIKSIKMESQSKSIQVWSYTPSVIEIAKEIMNTSCHNS